MMNIQKKIKEILKPYIYYISDEKIYLGNNQDICIEITEEMILIDFWGFNNILYLFNYSSFEAMLEELGEFLKRIFIGKIKIESYYAKNKVVKRVIYAGLNDWEKITSSTNIRYIFFKKEKRIKIIDVKGYIKNKS